ncbi:VCBS domain-containing protein [Parendozoicomonas sp. Alg238-R29]|uniref:VCBS domain-containing protein n=1 Tax=Parendozoicomonas sp. Alg238-R29 TaxID=2993446 RepID=UPI00248E847A|nr:VCBS domain-containing protein [Parendozoicomonas sp. Alg238-R29]
MEGAAGMIKVGEITGIVLAVTPDGSTRVLAKGNLLQPGETVQTANGSSVELLNPDGSVTNVPANSSLAVPQQAENIPEKVVESVIKAEEQNPSAGEEAETEGGGGAELTQSFGTTPAFQNNILNSLDGTSTSSVLPEQGKPLFSSFNLPEEGYAGKGLGSVTGAPPIAQPVANSPIDVTPPVTPQPLVRVGGTQVTTALSPEPDPIPTPEPDPVPTPEPDPVPTPDPDPIPNIAAAAASDTANILFGESLVQQSGILLNDAGTGLTLRTVNGATINDSGSTTIQGDYGTLTIQDNGSYSYTAEEVDIHSDLVAHWSFDQPASETAVLDQSGVDSVSDNGQLRGNAAIVSGGLSGSALRLDGIGDHVSVGNIHSTRDDYNYTVDNGEVLNTDFNDYTNQGWQASGAHAHLDPSGGGRLKNYQSTQVYRDVDTSDNTIEQYELTFTLYHSKSHGTTNIWLSWNGENVAHFSQPAGSGVVTTTETVILQASGDPTTQLRFSQDIRAFSIDNVVIKKVLPEDAPFNDSVEVAHTYVDPIESNGGDVEARTISFSFQPGEDNSLSDRQVLYTEGGGDGGFIIYIQNNTLYAGAHDGANWSGEYLSTDISNLDSSQWHNVALTLDGSAGTLEAFLNGDSFGVSNSAQSLNDAIGGVGIGSAGSVNKYHDGVQEGSFTFDGMIDEVRVYDRVLNNAEINTLTSGTDSPVETFDYAIEDVDGGTSSSSLAINLSSSLNLAPIAADDTLSVMSDQSVSVNSVSSLGLLANDADPEGATLRVTQVDDTAVDRYGTTNISGTYGTLIISSDGTYAYTPFNSAINGGVETFSYSVSDGTTTSTANLTVTVIEDSFANEDSVTITESALPEGSVYVLDDVNGSGVSLSVVNANTGETHQLGAISGSSNMYAIAMSPSGVLYGADSANLYTIDPATQVATVVGAHSISTVTGLTFAPDGSLYASGYDGGIFRVNTSSGAGTNIGDVSDAGQENVFGDITWHDGALYTQGYVSSPQAYTFVRIEPDGNSSNTIALPNAFDGGSLHALTSVDGQLTGVTWSTTSPLLVTIDTETGLIDERVLSTGTYDPENATNAEQLVEGNVLSNDTGATSVNSIALPDGTSRAVDSSGVTLQGVYGTITIRGDGRYIYNINNNLDATNNLAAGETGNDRFVYTATDSDGNTSQSILTVYVNGANEVEIADNAIFTDFTVVDSVDASSNNIPIDFAVSTQNDTDRITEIRIAKPADTTFDIPSEWTDNGTVTGNTAGSPELVWTTTPGIRAGLTEIDAMADGLTISALTGQRINISVTVTEYDVWGNASSDWTSTSAISLNLVGIDNTQTGTSGTDVINGTADNDEIIAGAGSDVLTGGDSQDFFVWQSGHEGTENSPTVDTITDFHTGVAGDVLDLRDLLPDNASGHLDEFLSFSFESGDTTIGVSTNAGGPVVQNIVLDGVDLSSTYGTTDVTQLTNQLTDNGNLLS